MFHLSSVLHRIPKAELHVHLRGAMPISVCTALLNRAPAVEALRQAPERILNLFQNTPNIRPFLQRRTWAPSEVTDLFRYEDFDQFLATYHFTSFFVRTAGDLRLLIDGVRGSLRAQGIGYAEVTISVIEYLQQGIDLDAIVDCMEAASSDDAPQVYWIVDLVRDIGHQAALVLLKRIIAVDSASIIGITIGGSEHSFPPAPFAEVYDMARVHGLRLTVHAGEALGPESVWDALRVLKAERIGHGVRSIEDPALIGYLVEQQIPLEVCPTSNLRTGVYPSYEAHPVKQLFDAGVPITLNTDDPTFFGTDLIQEYEHLARLGFSGDELLEIVKNGFRHAFLPQKTIDSYLEALECSWADERNLEASVEG